MSSRTTTTAWQGILKRRPASGVDFDHSKYETYVVEDKEYLSSVDEHHTVTYGGEVPQTKGRHAPWHRGREADRRNLSRHDQAIWLGRCEKAMPSTYRTNGT